MRTTTLLAILAGALGASAALARQHSDTLLQADHALGRVTTGAFDDATKMVVSTDERVFAGDFGETDPLQPNYSDEPGFRALAMTFAEGDQWGLNITDSVRVWDSASGNFDTLSPFTITLGFGPLSATSPASPGGFTPGFPITVATTGGFDTHLDVYLDAPGLDAAELDAPGRGAPMADGVYLLRLSAFATGLNASDDFWFVMNRGLDEAEHDRAVDYVREFLVPAPGGAATLACGVIALVRRRRPASTWGNRRGCPAVSAAPSSGGAVIPPTLG